MTKAALKASIVQALFRRDMAKRDLQHVLHLLTKNSTMAKQKKEKPRYFGTFKMGQRAAIGYNPDMNLSTHWVEIIADDRREAERIMASRFGAGNYGNIFTHQSWQASAHWFYTGRCILILGNII